MSEEKPSNSHKCIYEYINDETKRVNNIKKVAEKHYSIQKYLQDSVFYQINLGTASTIASISSQNIEEIEKEREQLERIKSLSNELVATKKAKKEKEALAERLQSELLEYDKREKIKYLRGKLAKDAENRIRTDKDFFEEFAPGKSHKTFVLSIDIRSSTELMLNSKTPESFAGFLTGLCEKLTNLIIENGGIFDKFTGDGVLAFFPEFYSGDDAGYRALRTSCEAISFFYEHYRKCRKCFNVVIANTGLGVGIDYGNVHFVNIGESLSVDGNPVVYACRLSSTDADNICVNQPAYELINDKYKAQTEIDETTLNIKNSGPINVYKVRLKGDQITPAELPWRAKPENESTLKPDPLPRKEPEEFSANPSIKRTK